MTKNPEFIDSIWSKFKHNGYYRWESIKYFLFEYELSLQTTSKTKRKKIDWREYNINKEDYVTVEHIFPQNAKQLDWPKFKEYTSNQIKLLSDSLGNLLPLSKPKNSSLQNIKFENKVDNNKNKTGYRYGSYSENEISKLSDWTPNDILTRGLTLFTFLEKRWKINIGDDSRKTELLGLSFLITLPKNKKSKKSS